MFLIWQVLLPLQGGWDGLFRYIQSFGVSFPFSKWWLGIQELCPCGTGGRRWQLTDVCFLVSTESSFVAPLWGILESATQSVVGAKCSLFFFIWPHPGSSWHCLIPGELTLTAIQFPTWTLQFLVTRPLHPCLSETLSSTIRYSVSQGQLTVVLKNLKILVA